MAFYSEIISDGIEIIDKSKDILSIRDDLIFSDTTFFNYTTVDDSNDGIKIKDKSILYYPKNTSDSINFSDSTSITILKNTNDIIKLGDAVNISRTIHTRCIEYIGFNDLISDINIKYNLKCIDSLSFNDDDKTVYTKLLNDIVQFNENTFVNIYRILSESFSLTDGSFGFVNYKHILLSDNIKMDDDTRFTIDAFVQDGVSFNDISEELRIRIDQSDVINISDITNVYDHFFVNASDTLHFSEYIKITISDYIKRLYTETIFDDNTKGILTLRPRIKENFGFFDINQNKAIHRSILHNNVGFNDKSFSSVYFHTSLDSSSLAKFDDVTTFNISRIKNYTFDSKIANSVGNVDSIIYTASLPTKESVTQIINVVLTNILSTNTIIHATVRIIKSDGKEIHIISDIPINTSETFIINNKEMGVFTMEDGDQLIVYSDTLSSLDVYVSLIEIQQ